jgi:hypothetical protein
VHAAVHACGNTDMYVYEVRIVIYFCTASSAHSHVMMATCLHDTRGNMSQGHSVHCTSVVERRVRVQQPTRLVTPRGRGVVNFFSHSFARAMNPGSSAWLIEPWLIPDNKHFISNS